MTRKIMNNELKKLAALALRNAFWRDFSALVNKYLEAARGLDTDLQLMQMGDLTSIYGRNTEEDSSDVFLNIWTQNGCPNATSNHDTILEALKYDRATDVHLRGKKIFERRDGEWFFIS